MMGNYHVRFGGGRLEKELHSHLVSRLPNNIRKEMRDGHKREDAGSNYGNCGKVRP